MSLDNFNRFIELGIIKKQKPDLSRVNSLVEEANKRKKFLEEILNLIGIKEENANYISESVYDILISLIRARMLKGGFKASGYSAHAAEISYLRVIGFKELDLKKIDRLRYFRNGVKYYGKQLTIEYAQQMIDVLNQNYPKLLGILENN